MANGHGGKREGAGRPRGAAWRSPTKELRHAARAKIVEMTAGAGDPLGYVVSLVADDKQPVAIRLHAASICLPYLLPRLSAVATVTGKAGGASSAELLERVLAKAARRFGSAARNDSPATIDGEAAPVGEVA